MHHACGKVVATLAIPHQVLVEVQEADAHLAEAGVKHSSTTVATMSRLEESWMHADLLAAPRPAVEVTTARTGTR
jgi:hypothetical protein